MTKNTPVFDKELRQEESQIMKEGAEPDDQIKGSYWKLYPFLVSHNTQKFL